VEEGLAALSREGRLALFPLFDAYGRPLTHLRVMVTWRCNYRCFFCHSEGYDARGGAEEVSVEEVSAIAAAGRRVGVYDYKLTGGEPLLRRDIVDIVKAVMEYGGRPRVSITTNGSLLAGLAGRLAEAGVDHVNVSLHALEPGLYRRITGVDMLDRVVEGVRRAWEHGLRVKANFVLLRGVNEGQLIPVLEFAERYCYRLQVIELYPVGRAASGFTEYHLPGTYVYSVLRDRVRRVRYRLGLHTRPILVLDDGFEVEVVLPVKNAAFCARCSRARVTWDAKLVPCLNWSGEYVDLRELWRGCRGFEEMVDAVVEGFRRLMRLRKPYTLYTRSDGYIPVRPRTLRLGLPKRDGTLLFTGARGREHLERLLEEWRDG